MLLPSSLREANLLINYKFSEIGGGDLNQREGRLSHFITLRPTARSAIITANALQKVFRARFEDSRAHANLNQIAQLASPQPFLTARRIPYEDLLGKTKANFFDLTHYHLIRPAPLDHLDELKTAHLYPYYSFPLLLSLKSDMARYV